MPANPQEANKHEAQKAVFFDDPERLAELFDKGLSPHGLFENGTWLDVAARLGASKCLALLLRLGLSPTSRKDGNSTIDWAILSKSNETLRTLWLFAI